MDKVCLFHCHSCHYNIGLCTSLKTTGVRDLGFGA